MSSGAAGGPGPFMPEEVLISRPRDASWERLTCGQRVTITCGGATAEMKVTDVITRIDGGETYVLENAAITGAELAERRLAAGAFYRSETCPDGEPGATAP